DEANRIPQTVEQKLIQEREDLRDQFIVTTDPDDARDFDDAINVEKIDHTGGWRLGVHIADVSAYVTPESALDREARRRGNSVYLPDRVIPMLPERLSNGVCSLNPSVDRLTHSVFIEFDKSGRAKNARFAKSVIRSANEEVARELRHRYIATIYRVHEDPDPEKLGEYREFILSFGYKVGDLSHRKEVQRFLASIKGKPEEQALKIGLLKSLKRARYA